MSPVNESYLACKAQISMVTLRVCVPIRGKAAGPPLCLRHERGLGDLGDVEVSFFIYSMKGQVSTGIRGVAELCNFSVWKPQWQPPQAISKSPDLVLGVNCSFGFDIFSWRLPPGQKELGNVRIPEEVWIVLIHSYPKWHETSTCILLLKWMTKNDSAWTAIIHILGMDIKLKC